MDNKIAYGSIGLLTLLLAFGGTIYLTEEQQLNTYICSTNQQVYIFEKLSSTNKTGYWIEEGISKSAVCKNGIFTKVKFPNEINLNEELISPSKLNAVQYLCNNHNCTRIK